MSELSICDHFRWSLEDVRKLTLREYRGVGDYLKQVNKQNKRALNKSKNKRA